MVLWCAQGVLNSSLRYKLQSTFPLNVREHFDTWILLRHPASFPPKIFRGNYVSSFFFIRFISFPCFFLIFHSGAMRSDVSGITKQKYQEENRRYCDRCNIPLIRKLVIRIANYPHRLGLSGKFVENSKKLTCLKITGYRIKYSTVLWVLELQIWRSRKV